MAVAAGLAAGAAALSGVALGLSCNMQARRPYSALMGKREDDDADAAAAGKRGKQPKGAAEPEVATLGWQGFSMEEARAHTDERQASAMKKTPALIGRCTALSALL